MKLLSNRVILHFGNRAKRGCSTTKCHINLESQKNGIKVVNSEVCVLWEKGKLANFFSASLMTNFFSFPFFMTEQCSAGRGMMLRESSVKINLKMILLLLEMGGEEEKKEKL